MCDLRKALAESNIEEALKTLEMMRSLLVERVPTLPPGQDVAETYRTLMVIQEAYGKVLEISETGELKKT